jgi:hypothetical protein
LPAPFKHIFQPNKCKEVNSTQLKENQVKKLATIKCSFKLYCFMTGDVLLLAVAESIS